MTLLSSLRGFSLLLLGLLATLPVQAADSVDRAAAYKAALPLYQYDARKPLAVKVIETKTFSGCRLTRFSYGSTNGQRVPALLFVPVKASAAHPAPCLVLLHGLGTNKEIMSGMAIFAAKKGYASLAIDEYGQGERGGPQTPGTDTTALQNELTTGVRQTVVDVRRGVDYLQGQPMINRKRIGLIGISMGAIIGTVAAGVEPRLKATALISGGGDWALILKSLSDRNANVGGKNLGAWKGMDWSLANLFLSSVDPLTFAPHIAPRALLMECGRKDDIILPRAATELYQAARQPKQIDWYAGYGHVPPPEAVYPTLQKWFAQHL